MSGSASSGICPAHNLLHLAWSKLLSQFPIFGHSIGRVRQALRQGMAKCKGRLLLVKRTASNADITLHLREAGGGGHFKTAEKNRDHMRRTLTVW